MAKQFGTRVDVLGIADVSAVPRLLPGTVRSAFRKEQTHPVMMDWSGEVVKVRSERGCDDGVVN